LALRRPFAPDAARRENARDQDRGDAAMLFLFRLLPGSCSVFNAFSALAGREPGR
jgi:hypothetical protein